MSGPLGQWIWSSPWLCGWPCPFGSMTCHPLSSLGRPPLHGFARAQPSETQKQVAFPFSQWWGWQPCWFLSHLQGHSCLCWRIKHDYLIVSKKIKTFFLTLLFSFWTLIRISFSIHISTNSLSMYLQTLLASTHYPVPKPLSYSWNRICICLLGCHTKYHHLCGLSFS